MIGLGKRLYVEEGQHVLHAKWKSDRTVSERFFDHVSRPEGLFHVLA